MSIFPKAVSACAAFFLSFGCVSMAVHGQPAGTPNYEDPHTSTIDGSLPFPTFGTLGGVAVDRSGRIYMSNFRGTVWRIEPDGEAEILATGLHGASGNAVRRDGKLLQANFRTGTIVKIDGQGRIEPFAEGIAGPVGVVEAPSGEVFAVACNGGQVMRISHDGRTVTEFSKHEWLECPNGLTFGPDGTLYVVNFNNTRVLAYDGEGEVSQLAHLPGRGNSHIAFLRGALYVTQIHTHGLFRVNLDGSYERVAGDGTRGFADGFGDKATISYPNGIATDGSSGSLVFNTLKGQRRGGGRGEMILRRLVPPSLLTAMQAAFETGGLSEARRIFDARLVAAGDETTGFLTRAVGATRGISNRGNHELATTMADWILERAPESVGVVIAAAEVNDAAGNYSRALELYEKLSVLLPDNDEVAKRIEDIRDFRSRP